VRLGVVPRYHSPGIASPDYLEAFAAMVDALGVESVWVSEHLVVPVEYRSRYPYADDGRMPTWPHIDFCDPIDTLAYVAALTRHVRLGSAVLVLPAHQPVVLAKRVATVDVLSRGRVLLGVGVGWLAEEFAAAGVPFDHRGARADEYIQALRALWSQPDATFHGRFVDFDAVQSDPKPAQRSGVPIVVGGHSDAAARRAGALGDGFYPLGVDVDRFGALVTVMRLAARDAGRDPDAIELTCWPVGGTFGGAAGEEVRPGVRDVDLVRRYADLGATRVMISAEEAPDGSVEGAKRYIGEILDTVVSRVG
jgi:probable F420-dependent oxidoreductase